MGAPFPIESAMYFGIGFLAASLLAMAIVPFALNRAVRLTTRRVLSTIPASLTGVRAEQDTVRAMFAVSVRKLEIRTEELVKQIAGQGAELGRRNSLIRKLKESLEEKSQLVAALEAREGALISRENSLVQELLALREESRRIRASTLATYHPPGPSPYNRERRAGVL